ncbi:hypothetical protein ASPTUDRAFT_165283 [Aspergillus tubingensis CBS 134.48]|uniref:Uncharacterized protein n=1 Tax=Aspergillus tubingensis (strain CBS 134.48) TaxID=767770 RepID=A0A1L9NA92_ASPTC|nr:hypothetical protein ASPTUDRAFT_165283 [Aspergillus tubingensis CBS 134.48]
MVSGQLRARPSVQGTLPEPVTANDSVVPCLPSSISPHCGSAAADLWFNCALLADGLPSNRYLVNSVEAVNDQASQWDRGILERGHATTTVK